MKKLQLCVWTSPHIEEHAVQELHAFSQVVAMILDTFTGLLYVLQLLTEMMRAGRVRGGGG